MAYLDKTGLERLWLQITAKLDNKVTKVDGKGLSTNDFTTAEKEQLATIISDYLKADDYAALEALIDNKVEKVDGKDLSTNDFTNEEKAALAQIFGDYLTSADKEELGGAIDDAIANIAQADWSMSNTADPSYIKNRTHFEVSEETLIQKEGPCKLEAGSGLGGQGGSPILQNGMNYIFRSVNESGDLIEEKAFTFEGTQINFNIKETTGGEVSISIGSTGVTGIGNSSAGVRIIYYEIYSATGIKQLEEKFIPTFTIEDIDEITGGCVIPDAPVCYTVRIDETNSNPLTCCEYMDDAVGMDKGSSDWDNKPIFNSIKPCTFINGHVNYYLDPDNFNLKEDGSAAALDGTDGDVMIEFQKFAYRLYKEGNYQYVSITNDPDLVASDSRFQYYAFSRDTVGDVDKMYIGAFKGWGDMNDMLIRSVANGEYPTTNVSLNQLRQVLPLKGANYGIMNYGQLVALQCLYLIKYGNLDSQAALGMGFVENYNEDMPCPMGGTIDKGMYYGSTADGLQQMKFAGIEDLWGNVAEWVEGFETGETDEFIVRYGNETQTVHTGMDMTGWDQYGYLSKIQGTTELGFSGAEFNGDETTYYADYSLFFPSCVLFFGAFWQDGADGGLFFLFAEYSADDAYPYFGARLTYL